MAFNNSYETVFYLLRDSKPDSADDCAGGIDITKPRRGVNRGPAPTCPKCGGFLGMLTWLPPYRVELETWGTHYGDIARTGDDLIVSDRFVDAFKRNSLKGVVRIDAVDVVKVVHRRGKPKEPMPIYFKASVIRSNTTIDQKASGYVWKDESKVCPECLFDTLKRYERIVIDESTWNGDDIFYPRGGNGPIVSERFRQVFLEQGLVGADFIPANEHHYDFYPWEK